MQAFSRGKHFLENGNKFPSRSVIIEGKKGATLSKIRSIGGMKMMFEKSCGAIVYRKHHGNIELLLIQNQNCGHWSFPKGHVESGETEAETAIREIKEETGIDVILDTSFRRVVTYAPRKETTKDVIYFLAKATTYDYVPNEDEIARIKWVEINHAEEILSYDNIRQLVTQAKPIIKDSY